MEIQFVHLSDLHLCQTPSQYTLNELIQEGVSAPNKHFLSILRCIRKTHPSIQFILVSGDLSHGGDLRDYILLKNWIQTECDVPVYVALGNHDNRAHFQRVFLDTGSMVSYDYTEALPGGIELVALDTGTDKKMQGSLSQRQYQWLENVLNKGDAPHRLLMMHHPPYIGEDIESMAYQFRDSGALWNTIKNKGFLAVLCGHTHRGSCHMFGDIPCFTAGSTAYGLSYTKTHAAIHNICSYSFGIIRNGQIYMTQYTLPYPRLIQVQKTYEEVYRGWRKDG